LSHMLLDILMFLQNTLFSVGIFPSPKLITTVDFQIHCLNSMDMLSFFAYLMKKLITTCSWTNLVV
jgi:hypothetical protein